MKGEQQFDNELSVHFGYHSKKNKSGKTDIYVRFHFFQKGIRVNEVLIATGISCLPDKWDGNRISGKASDVNAQLLNDKLDRITLTVKESLYELKRMKIQNPLSIISEIKNGLRLKITGKPPKGKKAEFISRLQEQTLESVKTNFLHGKNRSKSYINKFGNAINLLTTFLGHIPSLDEISKSDIEKFHGWMQRRKLSHNTIMTYLNRLRTLFLHAVELEIISQCPIPKRGLIQKYKGSNRIVLTEDELIKITVIKHERLSPSLEKTKYIFLFLCSTGLGYGELMSVRREHIEEINGQLYLQKDRNKTKQPFEVLFSPVAKKIYTQYFDWIRHETGIETTYEPFENLPSIEYFTRSLKALMKIAKIKKHVTSYTARHTFAVNWIRNGGCIVTLQKILGHRDLKTTQVYLNLLKEDKMNKANEVYTKSIFHSQF